MSNEMPVRRTPAQVALLAVAGLVGIGAVSSAIATHTAPPSRTVAADADPGLSDSAADRCQRAIDRRIPARNRVTWAPASTTPTHALANGDPTWVALVHGAMAHTPRSRSRVAGACSVHRHGAAWVVDSAVKKILTD